MRVYPTTEVLPCVSDMLVAAEKDCIEYCAVEKTDQVMHRVLSILFIWYEEMSVVGGL